METEKTVMDYVIEQASIYDGKNLDIEEEFIDDALSILTALSIKIGHMYISDVTTTLQFQTLMNKMQILVDSMYNEMYDTLLPRIEKHMDKGYRDMDDMIEIGHTMEEKLQSEKTQEMKNYLVDKNSIDFMRKHAFEQVTNISREVMVKLKTSISSMLLQGDANITHIRKEIGKVMEVSKSRVITIAQTEMSMAYNAGAIERMNEFNRVSTSKMRKYWYGFKYSDRTCTYCRPKIGTIYNVNDSTEMLPAHPKCRCLWLPYIDGWDKPISTIFTRKANMITRVYSPEQIYAKMNKRLGINYGEYLSMDDAMSYLAGDRSDNIKRGLESARMRAVDDTKEGFEISTTSAENRMNNEFKVQMGFWKKYVAEAMVDSNIDTLGKSYEAIKGVMILPWTGNQLQQFDKLLQIIKKRL